RTLCTPGGARDAEFASMPEQLVREDGPLLAREDRHQVQFNLLRIFLLRKLQATRQALNVRVHHNSIIPLEPRAEHDVGGLARDPRQSEQVLHVVRDLASEVADDLLRSPYHRL